MDYMALGIILGIVCIAFVIYIMWEDTLVNDNNDEDDDNDDNDDDMDLPEL